ncbi:MAG: amino acid adenylation domain-containing protein, partial [Ktedonobacteraceae bacterium]
MNDIEVEEALILPTSFAQQRLWFLAELEPNHPAYNIYRALHITGPLNRDALEQSFQCIIQRHETLRTTFVVVDGVPMQSIAPALHFSLPVVDLDPAEFERVALQEVRKPFNLAQGPLLRASLWRLDEQTHILLLILHHIITDGWSMEVFFRELAAFYQAAVAPDMLAATSLPTLPIQYADYALWEQEWLQGEVLAEQLSYWRKHLAGAPALLDLPTDHPRPRVQSYHGAHHTFLLPHTVLDQIQALAQREGVTPFMILLAAFQVLLMRYSGQTDIVVGIPFANRTQEEVTGLIGFFANTLALRLSFPEHASFQHILQQVRELTVEAYAHQELPFEKVVEDLQPERNRSYNPLVQVAFSFYEAVQPSPALPGLTTHFLEGLTNTSSKFDLSMLALPPAAQQQTLPGAPNDGLMLEWEYNTDLFEATTIQRMATHYATLLQSAVSQPEQQVTEIPLLTEEERRRMLGEWNATDTAYPRQMCVHQLVEVQAEQTPDAIAVTFEGEHLTYRELNIRANQLARYVSLLGVGPEVLVGLCLERSLTLVIAALAILKAGGAYVPLDPTSPPERLAFMLSDAGTPVLLTQENLRLDVSRCSAHVLYLDQLETDLVQQAQGNLTNTVTAQNLAYAIYTSGSTGQPKGVPITHQNVLNLVSWHTRTFGLTAQDRASHLAGLSFDATVWEMWPYLASGACLILAPEQARFSPTLLQAWLLAQHVTLSFVPTPLAEPLLQLPWPAQTSLRWLLTGGDRLQHFPPATLPFLFSNNYGPTENTVVATSLVVTAQKQADVLGLDAPSIGHPIANTQAYVLDTHLQPVPIGVPGELCIGGESLTRGYLHLPAITAERFIPDPFSTKVGARLYRTGDKVRYLPDVSLAFLGRLDFQVKIRGFRIELGEIESLLHQHPLVEETVALAQESSPGEMRLVAYVVSKQTAHATSNDLRTFL